ncbi:lipopolysaccharide assembly protein A [Pseudomonas sp. IT-P100]|uniref:LapA family protein n=1 Tax=Pseudomonas sp. IT-P100 TaxID=3026452 RepID=UPI0039E07630
MGNLKRALLAVLVLLLALAVLAFSLENQQSVSLIFLGWAGPKLPLSLITITALLVGMIVGPALYWVFMRRSRVSKKRIG